MLLLVNKIRQKKMQNKKSKTFKADVKFIIDGDTFEIQPHGSEDTMRVRLYGVDAPERGQEYGGIAQYLMQKNLLNQTVDVRIMQTAHKGREVAMLWLQNGDNVNLNMVKDGLAWSSIQYNDEYALAILDAEINSKVNKVGLWSRNKPEQPYLYRNRIDLSNKDHYKDAVKRDKIEVEKFKSGYFNLGNQKDNNAPQSQITNNNQTQIIQNNFSPSNKKIDFDLILNKVKEAFSSVKSIIKNKKIEQAENYDNLFYPKAKEISVNEAMKNLKKKRNANKP